MSVIKVDSNAVLAIKKAVQEYRQRTERAVNEFTANIRNKGGDWNDDDYKAFAQTTISLNVKLSEIANMCSEFEVRLEKKAESILNYDN
ncbi:MAG: hypothetical protein FWH03_05320 [Firmicutes bacterium]|nr:hypothetical protein [Bacillota bacterium]